VRKSKSIPVGQLASADTEIQNQKYKPDDKQSLIAAARIMCCKKKLIQ